MEINLKEQRFMLGVFVLEGATLDLNRNTYVLCKIYSIPDFTEETSYKKFLLVCNYFLPEGGFLCFWFTMPMFVTLLLLLFFFIIFYFFLLFSIFSSENINHPSLPIKMQLSQWAMKLYVSVTYFTRGLQNIGSSFKQPHWWNHHNWKGLLGNV